MNPGKLSDLIVFESVTTVTDSFGSEVETWAQAFQAYAEYQPIGSREFPVLQKRQSETTARFVIWYRDDIDPALHRILFEGKHWNISEPLHDRERITTTIEASEIE